MKIETLKKWREIASIFALVAIPVGVPITVALMQSRGAEETVRQQYVNLAIGILREPAPKPAEDTKAAEVPKDGAKPPDAADETKKEADIALRRWAVDMVNASAPIKFPDPLKKDLTSGQTGLKVVEGLDLWSQPGGGTAGPSMYDCTPTEPYRPGDTASWSPKMKCKPADNDRGIHYK